MKKLALPLLIFLLALMVRLTYVQNFKNLQPTKDSAAYHSIAHHILTKQEFSQDGIHPTARRPPLYPFFLAGTYLFFGENPQRVREAQALLGALTAVLTFFLGARLFGETIGAAGSFVLAVHHLPVSLSAHLLTETLFGFLLLCLALSLYHLEISRKRWTAVLCGIFLGLLLLHRAESILLWPILIFWFLRRSGNIKEKIRGALSIYGLSFLLILPWTLRNLIQLGAFVPVSSAGGDVLWASNKPESYGRFQADIDFALPSVTHSESQITRIYSREAFRNISRAPLATLRNVFLKLIHLLHPTGEAGFDFFLGPIYIGCLLALFLTRPIPGFDAILVLLAFILLKTLIFYASVRFLTPFLPLFILCAVSGYDGLFKKGDS